METTIETFGDAPGETHATGAGETSGAREGTRTLKPCGTRSLVLRVYQFRHPSEVVLLENRAANIAPRVETQPEIWLGEK